MELSFLGACRQVGRSQFQANAGEVKLLLDSGSTTFAGARFPLNPSGKIDAVVLSHAHLDHSGFIPVLFRRRNIPVYCTAPTLPIANLLWEDAIKVADKRGEPPYLSHREIQAAAKHTVPMPYNEAYEFFDGTRFTLFDAGHISGSAQTLLEEGDTRLLYTGDLNAETSRMHNGAKPPAKDVDALIIESTYANREHPLRQDVERTFIDAIEETLETGNAIIPCFAVGRTQELLMVLSAHNISAPVYVDGMGIQTSTLVTEYPSYVRDYRAMTAALQHAQFVEDGGMRRKIAEGRGKIIIATAGMLDGGPVLTYIQRANKHGRGSILLTGFQVPGTNGRNLVERGFVRDMGRTIPVNLPVKTFDFSAHSGRSALFDFVKKVNPQKVFCVHGDEPTAINFAQELREQYGFDARAPEPGEKCSL